MFAGDHLLAALLVLGLPVYARWDLRRFLAALDGGDPRARLRAYRLTMALHLSLGASVAGIWGALGRDLRSIGILAPGGLGFWLAAGASALVTAYLAWQARIVARDSGTREKIRGRLGHLATFLPHTSAELTSFSWLALSAGVFEELLYRGFLMWYALAFLPTWAAVLVTSLAFGAAHSYQGPIRAMQTGVAGLAMAGLYVLSSSLWVPMALHTAADLLQGRMIHYVLRSDAVPVTVQT